MLVPRTCDECDNDTFYIALDGDGNLKSAECSECGTFVGDHKEVEV